MANIRDVDTGFTINFLFKRKHHQHVRHRALDFFDATTSPRPDRWADEMHRRDTGLLQIGFKSEIEIWRIDTDEHRRALGDQSRPQ